MKQDIITIIKFGIDFKKSFFYSFHKIKSLLKFGKTSHSYLYVYVAPWKFHLSATYFKTIPYLVLTPDIFLPIIEPTATVAKPANLLGKKPPKVLAIPAPSFIF